MDKYPVIPDAYEISFLETVLFGHEFVASNDIADLYDAMAEYFREKQSSFDYCLKEGKDVPAGLISSMAISFIFRYLQQRIKAFKTAAFKAQSYQDIIYETMRDAFSKD